MKYRYIRIVLVLVILISVALYFTPYPISISPQSNTVRLIMDDKGSPIQLSIKEKEQVLDILNNQKQQRTLTPTQWSLPMEWIYNIRISGEHDYQIIIKARRVWIYSESMKTVHKLLIEDDFYTKMDELLIS